jgi:hypothetical protein
MTSSMDRSKVTLTVSPADELRVDARRSEHYRH